MLLCNQALALLYLFTALFRQACPEMFPYEIHDVEEAKNKDIIRHFTGHQDGCVEVGPHKYCLPQLYREHAEGYYNVEVREDDIWIVTFPRSGTTWTQELIWLVSNDLDFEKAQSLKPHEKFPFIEVPVLHSKEFQSRVTELNKDNAEAIKMVNVMNVQGYETIKDVPSPRFIKSHLPLSLLPANLLDKAKVIYVARNPKDAAVSYFYHNTSVGIHGYEGSYEKYWEFFEHGLVMYGPQIPHVKEALDRRDHPNLLFIFYEDMIKDLPGNIRKVAEFLNKPITDEGVKKLADYLSFDNMKAVTKMAPPVELKGVFKPGSDFFRRGKVGGNSEYTQELSDRADKWVAEQCELYGVSFPNNR